jgi:multidrug transporter EmrE-like cation transporter
MRIAINAEVKTHLVFYLALGAALGAEVLADALLKRSSSGDFRLFFAGMILYSLTAYQVIYLFKKADFEIVFIVWEALGIVLALAVATLYLGEPVTVQELLGLCFAIGAILCSYF